MNDAVSHLRLFRESSGCTDPSAGDREIEWAFVPASDILLAVGEGIVGITPEGLMAEGPSGYERESFFAVIMRLPKQNHGKERKEEQESKLTFPAAKALLNDRSREGNHGPDRRRSRSRSHHGSGSASDHGKEGGDAMEQRTDGKDTMHHGTEGEDLSDLRSREHSNGLDHQRSRSRSHHGSTSRRSSDSRF
mmetsp:Transcript_112969/g.252087  ORF Transcript_112969/g.252087 Transcript_112969/m.252087 type:complete len:192 (+) Transcript_112969:3-578(+)